MDVEGLNVVALLTWSLYVILMHLVVLRFKHDYVLFVRLLFRVP